MLTFSRFKYACAISVLCFAAIAASPPSGDFVFETKFVRYVITSEGRNKSLFDKTNHTELLASAGAPFASVRLKDGRAGDASSISKDGSTFRVEFKSVGVAARYKISSTSNYILIGLDGIEGPEPQELQLAQLHLSPLSHSGSWIVVRWNDKVAVSLMALSDQVNSRLEDPSSIVSSIQSAFSFAGGRVAIVAAPTAGFMDAVHKLETDQNLPYCRLNGNWGKASADVKTSYLFTNMTEANADEVIRYASLGGFRYILISSPAWSQTLGSYEINTRNFPSGEKGLVSIAGKCHKAGLKVGLHMLTSLVSRNDPLVKSDLSMLLTDAETALANDIGEGDTEISATSPLDDFRKGGLSEDLQIGEELVRCPRIGGPRMDRFMNCARGVGGTKAAPHKAGEKIRGLSSDGGNYFVDLKTPLTGKVSQRIADLFNRCGFDMIYFDAGELNSRDGPFWYWGGRQQMDIWRRISLDLLVQGSGSTPWTWHIWCRYTTDDLALTAVKQYLDFHKIASYMNFLNDNFMPAELGWWGILGDAPDHRATTPDEVELLGVRSAALDVPFSIEADVESLRANGRTEEMLRMLSQYERLRLSGNVTADVRNRLRNGEWHLVDEGGKAVFYPVVYSTQYGSPQAKMGQTNNFKAQPFRFRLEAAPLLAKPDDAANIVLCDSISGFALGSPITMSQVPGFVAGRFEFIKGASAQSQSVFINPAGNSAARGDGSIIDLRGHRALAVTLKVEGAAPVSVSNPAVLNVQLEAGGRYREYYVNLDFSGTRTVIIKEPTSERVLPEFGQASYSAKLALMGFNYSGVNAINIRWMRLFPSGPAARISIVRIEALAESSATLQNPELLVNNETIQIPAELRTNDYAEFWGIGPIRIFDKDGNQKQSVPQPTHIPTIRDGENTIAVKGPASADVKLTTILLGDPVSP
jgi:hypothetical protein